MGMQLRLIEWPGKIIKSTHNVIVDTSLIAKTNKCRNMYNFKARK